MSVSEKIKGRLMSQRELNLNDNELIALNDLESINAINRREGKWFCQRCHNNNPQYFYINECDCHQECVYCLNCLPFGKLRTCDYLLHIADDNIYDWQAQRSYLHWKGQLSEQQQQAADEICTSFVKHENRLVWAVTGAGKTEIIFPVIDKALMNGQRVVIATPRIDVANELQPRLASAFPEINILLLHSQSEDSYQMTPIVLCSTHQLIRFKHCFDLVIIDEIDAFPFQGDKMLNFAAKRAAKLISSTILLTATPDLAMQKRIKQKTLDASILPARYHRHALAVPKHIWVGDWRTQIQREKIPRPLLRCMRQLLQQQHRFLIFVPNINLMQTIEQLFKYYFPHNQFESVSSIDKERIEKVANMRAESYDFLLTTTILERGVTFPAIDVIVLGSEDDTFTMASLVQISGRVGRKGYAPTGKVFFCHFGKTKASTGAIKQIKQMNWLAKKRGLVDG